ncbi:MAG: sulfotransferase [Acidobacteria bacterium]|nr:MAG: sulfotransferase [Acidobacteriota bacterium]
MGGGSLRSRPKDLREWAARWLFSPLDGARFGDFARVLLQNRLRVHPLYLPRLALTVLSSMWTSARARREERVWAGRLARVRVERPLFVLGHYRSGTTLLQGLLAADPRFAYPSYFEASFPWTFLTAPRSTWERFRRLTPPRRPHDDVEVRLDAPCEDEIALASMTFLSPHLCWHFPAREKVYRRYVTFERALPEERRRWQEAARLFAAKLTARHGRPLVFKSPCHTARIPLILEAFPDARFVHVHRHPFDVLRSTLHMERMVPPLMRYQRPREDEAALEDRVLWRYREIYGAYLRHRASIPAGRLCEITYRELVSDPLGALERIYRELELPGFGPARNPVARFLERARNYRPTAHAELRPEFRRRAARELAFAFETFGYRP